ncbi:MAG TPA: carboxypeptidase-like regulatory domain-containing protein [Trichocoleus sp.]
MNRKLLVSLTLAAAAGSLALTLGTATKALAHAVETNYILTQQAGSALPGLEFQSIYSTGEPLNGATVEIYAPNNPEQPWQEITADAEGRFAFTPDPAIPGDWEVIIRQEGHGDIWTVPVDEMGIEYDKIGLDRSSDIHYAAAPMLTVGAGAIATVAATAAWAVRRRAV